ncbi:MAG: peptide chain release factor N(5)-glutamine methyltransferase [Acidimicrobiales bacterium]
MNEAPPTWRSVLAAAEGVLGPGQEARWVVERASGWDGAELAVHLDDAAPARAVALVDKMVARRAAGEPLQYVLGRWAFRGLDLFVDRRVLIPRPETEVVAGAAVAEAQRGRRSQPVVVDLGTGSGAIALAVAAEVATAEVWATDVSPGALAVARANLAGLPSLAAARVRLAQGSWFDALPAELAGTAHVVVSNPPYVADGEALPPEVADWEPDGALRAGPTGLEALEVVIGGAPAWLAPGGSVVAEMAPCQAQPATALAWRAGFADVELLADLAGRPRVLVGRI